MYNVLVEKINCFYCITCNCVIFTLLIIISVTYFPRPINHFECYLKKYITLLILEMANSLWYKLKVLKQIVRYTIGIVYTIIIILTSSFYNVYQCMCYRWYWTMHKSRIYMKKILNWSNVFVWWYHCHII